MQKNILNHMYLWIQMFQIEVKCVIETNITYKLNVYLRVDSIQPKCNNADDFCVISDENVNWIETSLFFAILTKSKLACYTFSLQYSV